MNCCEQCKKTIRVNSKKAIFLFDRELPGEKREEVYVCSLRCLNVYNDGEDDE
jgi:hypothetical protein